MYKYFFRYVMILMLGLLVISCTSDDSVGESLGNLSVPSDLETTGIMPYTITFMSAKNHVYGCLVLEDTGKLIKCAQTANNVNFTSTGPIATYGNTVYIADPIAKSVYVCQALGLKLNYCNTTVGLENIPSQNGYITGMVAWKNNLYISWHNSIAQSNTTGVQYGGIYSCAINNNGSLLGICNWSKLNGAIALALKNNILYVTSSYTDDQGSTYNSLLQYPISESGTLSTEPSSTVYPSYGNTILTDILFDDESGLLVVNSPDIISGGNVSLCNLNGSIPSCSNKFGESSNSILSLAQVNEHVYLGVNGESAGIGNNGVLVMAKDKFGKFIDPVASGDGLGKVDGMNFIEQTLDKFDVYFPAYAYITTKNGLYSCVQDLGQNNQPIGSLSNCIEQPSYLFGGSTEMQFSGITSYANHLFIGVNNNQNEGGESGVYECGVDTKVNQLRNCSWNKTPSTINSLSIVHNKYLAKLYVLSGTNTYIYDFDVSAGNLHLRTTLNNNGEAVDSSNFNSNLYFTNSGQIWYRNLTAESTALNLNAQFNGESATLLTFDVLGHAYVITGNSGLGSCSVKIGGTFTNCAQSQTVQDGFSGVFSDIAVRNNYLYATTNTSAGPQLYSYPITDNGTIGNSIPITINGLSNFSNTLGITFLDNSNAYESAVVH